MGTFNINETKIEVSYSYNDANVIVNGDYRKGNANALIDVKGSIFRKTAGGQGDFIGNFNGTVSNGNIKYNISNIDLQDVSNVQAAISAIEQEITKTNDGEGE